MFSFRSRRATAVRRLWRLQAELAEEAGWGAPDISQAVTSNTAQHSRTSGYSFN